LAACLLIGNQKEVAMGKFAVPHAKNEKVKQFAQEMIEAHSKTASQLQKWVGREISLEVGQEGPHAGTTTQTRTDIRTTTPGQQPGQQLGQQPGQQPGQPLGQQPGQRPGQPGQPGQLSQQPTPRTATPGQQAGAQTPGQQRTETRSTTTRTEVQQERTVPTSIDVAGSSDMADRRLMIEREAAQKCLELTKQELMRHQEDFDQAYMGQQVGSHIGMLALLETFERHASDAELRQLIQQSRSTTQDHLHKANELIRELSPSSGRAPGRDNDATKR
jgi:predicted outer membrane protein